MSSSSSGALRLLTSSSRASVSSPSLRLSNVTHNTRRPRLSNRYFSQTYSKQTASPSAGSSAPRQETPDKSGEATTEKARDKDCVYYPASPRSSLTDAFITALVGLSMVFVGGIVYLEWYKKNVLDKIELAFAKGYDPVLDLTYDSKKREAAKSESLDWDSDSPWTEHLIRQEQSLVNNIVNGLEPGHYFILLGPKGTGKATMILDAMRRNQAEGVAMCDAHPDLEVFRLRLGKALNYEYNEDSQTGLFQRRDPREGGPALDIERALHKLEKVALRHASRTGKPLVLILNNIHFFNNNDDGKHMLLQLQQRAEAWAARGILTMVFTSDDFWPFFVMRKSASRMHVVSVYDLDEKESHRAVFQMRRHSGRPMGDEADFGKTVSIVGGRLAYLSKAAKASDMAKQATHLKEVEKAWLLSQIGLIDDCDDDVMDEQKWSSCSWLLMREFVRRRREDERKRDDAIAAGVHADQIPEITLPKIPYHECRQIMTRTDYLEELDRANVIAIDIKHDVTPDSKLILLAAQEVVEAPGFDDLLDSVRNRIDEIESLHRTRELTFKDVKSGDRIRLSVDKGGALLVDG